MKVSVIGCGRWGSFIAWYLDSIGHEVTLYGRAGSRRMEAFLSSRTNGLVSMPASLSLTTSLSQAAEAEVIVVSVGAQSFRVALGELAAQGYRRGLVLCMKGIEIDTGLRLSQVANEVLPGCSVAVWLGPGHVQEFTAGIPNCMVIDSLDAHFKDRLIQAFGSSLIRFYYGQDLIGNEVGAAAKNVVGIAAGVLDGLGMANLKGALMARGTREVARLIAAMGGSEISAYGLCHLGDYQATVFSPYSHNRLYGELMVKGQPYEELAEGCYTVKALLSLSDKLGVDMPISASVYRAIYEHADPAREIEQLFMRSLKREF